MLCIGYHGSSVHIHRQSMNHSNVECVTSNFAWSFFNWISTANIYDFHLIIDLSLLFWQGNDPSCNETWFIFNQTINGMLRIGPDKVDYSNLLRFRLCALIVCYSFALGSYSLLGTLHHWITMNLKRCFKASHTQNTSEVYSVQCVPRRPFIFAIASKELS